MTTRSTRFPAISARPTGISTTMMTTMTPPTLRPPLPPASISPPTKRSPSPSLTPASPRPTRLSPSASSTTMTAEPSMKSSSEPRALSMTMKSTRSREKLIIPRRIRTIDSRCAVGLIWVQRSKAAFLFHRNAAFAHMRFIRRVSDRPSPSRPVCRPPCPRPQSPAARQTDTARRSG